MTRLIAEAQKTRLKGQKGQKSKNIPGPEPYPRTRGREGPNIFLHEQWEREIRTARREGTVMAVMTMMAMMMIDGDNDR